MGADHAAAQDLADAGRQHGLAEEVTDGKDVRQLWCAFEYRR